jgi:hypothetical protein
MVVCWTGRRNAVFEEAVRVIWGAGRGEEFGLMILVVGGAAVFEEAVRVIWGAGRGKEFGAAPLGKRVLARPVE